jgi:hypothetical protein
MMLDRLRAHDRDLVELVAGPGAVMVAPNLQGRIFCHIRGELIHRLDIDRLENPSRNEFNNLGGNSLWPAPEGGPFAFNYAPGSDAWYVQTGIAEENPSIVQQTATGAEVGKDITLLNRRGTEVKVRFTRSVTVAPEILADAPSTMAAVAYRTIDSLAPLGAYSPRDVLLAAWSLEQIAGIEGVTAFGRVEDASKAINADYYGDPSSRLHCCDGLFLYALGGRDRQQIGIRTASRPAFIGALDTKREILILRHTKEQDGLYFNIADNEQPQGPYSAADLYSIFNGGELGFYELETIAPMKEDEERLAPSELVSETVILKGPVPELKVYLHQNKGIDLEEV